jgi:hypothetical protein
MTKVKGTSWYSTSPGLPNPVSPHFVFSLTRLCSSISTSCNLNKGFLAEATIRAEGHVLLKIASDRPSFARVEEDRPSHARVAS